MAELQRKSLRTPDEVETFPLGVTYAVHIGDLTVARNVHQPGWHWAEHVRPIVGGTSCRFRHTGVVLRGRIHWRQDDGTEVEFGPDEVFDVPPGHDAWIVGDEEFESIDWVGSHRWASPPAGERILATVVISDIVDSTRLAEGLGDSEWVRRLDEHNTRIRAVLDRYRGREVATTGDGMLSIFDGTERAIRASAAMHVAVARLDLRIRVGVHTGEIEVMPGDVRGVAVHLAARIAALAGPGEVLVSGTTRELVADGELAFDDRGHHELKGVSGPRAVFALRTP